MRGRSRGHDQGVYSIKGSSIKGSEYLKSWFSDFQVLWIKGSGSRGGVLERLEINGTAS